MPAVAVIGAVAGVAGAVSQASAAKKATAAQVASAKDQVELSKAIYEDQKSMFSPYREAGGRFQEILDYEMGIGAKPVFGAKTLTAVRVPGIKDNRGRIIKPATWTVEDKTFATEAEATAYATANSSAGTEYRGFTATPGYAFRLKQGTDAVEGSAAAAGSLFSGSTLKDLNTFGQGMASEEVNNYLNRITTGAAQGQAAAGNTALAAGNFGQAAGGAMQSSANAIAAGAIARGNAINNGLTNLVTAIQPAPKPTV